MRQQTPPVNKVKNKKLQQYTKDLNELNERYQYQLVPILRYSPTEIKPGLDVVDIPPPKKAGKVIRKPKGDKPAKVH